MNCYVSGMNPSKRICALNLSGTTHDQIRPSPTCQRLARSFSELQKIQSERDHRQDPRFGTLVEDQIVWRELLDLELQEVDEHIARIAVPEGSG